MSADEMMSLEGGQAAILVGREEALRGPADRESVSHSGQHDTNREGVRLGLVVATTIWAFIALVDVAAGQPFRTFDLFGGVIVFTAVHYLLSILYGVTLMSTIHGAERAPSLMYAFGFGLLFSEVVFAFVTVAFSNVGLGDLAWLRIFGASVVGAAVAVAVIARHHSLARLLHQAEAET
jgi:hypothetical protein